MGVRRSLHFVFAAPAGWGLLFSVSGAGVGAMVVALPAQRLGIQALGVGYLLWLVSNLTYALIGSLLRDWLGGPDLSGRRLRWFNREMAIF